MIDQRDNGLGLPPTTTATYWLSPVPRCNCCDADLPNALPGASMYDVSVPRWRGTWANVCLKCFQDLGCTIGIGKGQHYVKQPDGKWLCVAGGFQHGE